MQRNIMPETLWRTMKAWGWGLEKDLQGAIQVSRSKSCCAEINENSTVSLSCLAGIKYCPSASN